MLKTFEITLPKRVAFIENEIYYVEAESENEAIKLIESGAYVPEYEDAGEYETIDTYEIVIEEVKNA
jgi:hypothetical protein